MLLRAQVAAPREEADLEAATSTCHLQQMQLPGHPATVRVRTTIIIVAEASTTIIEAGADTMVAINTAAIDIITDRVEEPERRASRSSGRS